MSENKNILKRRYGLIRFCMLFLIWVYKKILSPFMGRKCRYYPTCSSYAYLCFYFLPIHKAFYFSAKRILSCNPMGEGGFDYPPGMSDKDKSAIDKILN